MAEKCSHGGIVACAVCGKYKGDGDVSALYRDVMGVIDRVDTEAIEEVFARWEGRPTRSFDEIDEALR